MKECSFESNWSQSISEQCISSSVIFEPLVPLFWITIYTRYSQSQYQAEPLINKQASSVW